MPNYRAWWRPTGLPDPEEQPEQPVETFSQLVARLEQEQRQQREEQERHDRFIQRLDALSQREANYNQRLAEESYRQAIQYSQAVGRITFDEARDRPVDLTDPYGSMPNPYFNGQAGAGGIGGIDNSGVSVSRNPNISFGDISIGGITYTASSAGWSMYEEPKKRKCHFPDWW